METVTNAANKVGSVASKAIWGEPAKDTKDATETPVSDTAPNVPLSSVPKKDPTADTLQATKIEPLVPSGTITPTPTETLESTHIAPLEDAGRESTLRKVEDKLPVDSGLKKKVEDKLDVAGKGESSKTADITPPTVEKNATPVSSTVTAEQKPSLKDKLKLEGEKLKEKFHKH